ncbi:nuclear transport factor 2 family protein [Streptomyces sp. DSM 44917]|uniref:Nuclear transport factor 2 family protein n=1 Tax=Streptomyces boetiae TaxID=3075541 RepID=A0ABU2LEV6_9ACTN|nr:nuclear transport factor 2 family protein [Streptomyces sp. DSM 44917]MDT0310127.1 nuclear transport factor 2 family protein [Streptomyces sp. DSM 44917]
MSATDPLRDRLEVADLLTRLTHWLDDPEAGDGGAIYAEDAVVRSPRGRFEGLAAIRELVTAPRPGGELTQHFTSDVLAESEGDTASLTAHTVTVFFHAGRAPHRTVGLRFAATAARTPDGWRIARAEITPQWFSPAPA